VLSISVFEKVNTTNKATCSLDQAVSLCLIFFFFQHYHELKLIRRPLSCGIVPVVSLGVVDVVRVLKINFSLF
jgi:hypothetical protein